MRWIIFYLALMAGLLVTQCGSQPETAKNDVPKPGSKPAVLLITLDTTRADHLGFEGGEATPHLDALAARSRIYRRAYTTAPTTLPAHVSMMTGLYPYEHGIHENARYLSQGIPTLAERLVQAGYRTAAFVSGYPLDATFGLGRGFETYEQPSQGAAERVADETTASAIRFLRESRESEVFVWVHYYDPHAPYQPPADLAEAYRQNPYQGEIAGMDRAIGRLLAAWASNTKGEESYILVVGDHGEGLGEGGEAQHGHLLSEGVMRVPMLVAGTGLATGEETKVFSTRKVFDLILGLAGLGPRLDRPDEPVVLAEAMKPFLQYGWAPQTLAVGDGWKAIRANSLQIYDLSTDPKAERDRFGEVALPRQIKEALESYALPKSLGEAPELSQEDVARLASLGYSASQGLSVLRTDMANPADMVHLLPKLDEASHAFSAGDYPQAIQAFESIVQEDPNNLMAQLRLAVAHSQMGHRQAAEKRFEKAGNISPESVDVRHYLAMHYLRFADGAAATPHLAWVLKRQPNRLPALKALARIRDQRGEFSDAARLYERGAALSGEGALHLKAALARMQLRDSEAAVAQFAAAAAATDSPFLHHLEWGLCLLDLRRLDEAAVQLESVAPEHPQYAFALFKRAQAGALRGDGDVREWIEKALQQGHAQVRQLIQQDGLLRPYL